MYATTWCHYNQFTDDDDDDDDNDDVTTVNSGTLGERPAASSKVDGFTPRLAVEVAGKFFCLLPLQPVSAESAQLLEVRAAASEGLYSLQPCRLHQGWGLAGRTCPPPPQSISTWSLGVKTDTLEGVAAFVPSDRGVRAMPPASSQVGHIAPSCAITLRLAVVVVEEATASLGMRLSCLLSWKQVAYLHTAVEALCRSYFLPPLQPVAKGSMGWIAGRGGEAASRRTWCQ